MQSPPGPAPMIAMRRSRADGIAGFCRAPLSSATPLSKTGNLVSGGRRLPANPGITILGAMPKRARVEETGDGTRRTEILDTAASLIASSGLRTSLQEIADAAGILPGSLYHHFESKEAILIELIHRYQADLDRIGRAAQARLDEPDSRPVAEQITELGSEIANCAVH